MAEQTIATGPQHMAPSEGILANAMDAARNAAGNVVDFVRELSGREIAAAALAGTVALAGCGHNTSKYSAEQKSEIAKKFGVKTVNPNDECVTLVEKTKVGEVTDFGTATTPNKVVTYKVGALQDGRKWTDALSTPVANTDKIAVLEEVKSGICEDPLERATVGNALAELTIAGINLKDLNPGLKKFSGDPSTINDVAKQSMPLLDHDSTPLTDKETDAAIAAAKAGEKDAALINTLLDRFENDGIQQGLIAAPSYHLAGGGIAAGQLPEVGIDPNAFVTNGDKASLVLTATAKSIGCLAAFGIDTGDQRPELLKGVAGCEAAPAPAAPGKTPEKPGTSEQPGKHPKRRNTGGSTTVPVTDHPGTTAPNTTQPLRTKDTKNDIHPPKEAPTTRDLGNPEQPTPTTVKKAPPATSPTTETQRDTPTTGTGGVSSGGGSND